MGNGIMMVLHAGLTCLIYNDGFLLIDIYTHFTTNSDQCERLDNRQTFSRDDRRIYIIDDFHPCQHLDPCCCCHHILVKVFIIRIPTLNNARNSRTFQALSRTLSPWFNVSSFSDQTNIISFTLYTIHWVIDRISGQA